jgi:hypothetical protein
MRGAAVVAGANNPAIESIRPQVTALEASLLSYQFVLKICRLYFDTKHRDTKEIVAESSVP